MHNKNIDLGIDEEEAEQIEERNKQNALMRKTMDASRGARYKLNNPVPAAEPEHKTAQAHNKSIGRALRNEESEQIDEISKSTLDCTNQQTPIHHFWIVGIPEHPNLYVS